MTSESKKKNADWLSNLPEDVISHILSLMSTIFAVRTSLLSEKWRYRWLWIHSLVFDNIHTIDCLSEFVDQVLKFCKSSQLKLLKLHITKFNVLDTCVSKWIDEAVKLNVCELDLRVKKLEYPWISLITCKTLANLKLDFTSRKCPVLDCPSFVNLPCLKTFHIYVPGKLHQYAFKVIHGCPALENLSLETRFHKSDEDYVFNIPTLKRLTLSIIKSLSSLVNKIVLNVPNLEYLCVTKRWNPLFVMEDVSSLVEAKFSWDIRKDHLWLKVLKGIRGAQRKICLNVGVYERGWREPQSVPSCMHMNLKTMKYTHTEGDQFDINFLKFVLANSKVLKMLTVEFVVNLSIEEKEQLIAKLSKLERASRDCQIQFVGN